MFIVHGTTRKIRSLGWVAEFCPICRRPQTFELIRVGLARHLYFISFGEGKLAGHFGRCAECRTQLVVDESRYKSIARKKPDDFAALAAETMPDLPEKLGDRLKLEQRVAADPASLEGDLRAKLMMEPFRLLDGMLGEQLQGGTKMDAPAGFGCFGTIALAIGFFVALVKLPHQWENQVMVSGAIVVGIGILYTLVQMHLVPRRFVRKQIVPRLAKSLAPLRPVDEEIANALLRCKQGGLEIGTYVKAGAVQAALAR